MSNQTVAPDRTIQIPSQYMGGIDAELQITSDDGERATIALAPGRRRQHATPATVAPRRPARATPSAIRAC